MFCIKEKLSHSSASILVCDISSSGVFKTFKNLFERENAREGARERDRHALPAGPLCKCLPQPGPVQAKPRARNLLWVCHACQRTRPRALHCHLPGTLAGCWMEGGWLNPCAMRPVPLVMSRPAGRLCLTLQASCVVGSCLVTGVHPIILNGPLSSQFSDRLGWGQMLCLCR